MALNGQNSNEMGANWFFLLIFRSELHVLPSTIVLLLSRALTTPLTESFFSSRVDNSSSKNSLYPFVHEYSPCSCILTGLCFCLGILSITKWTSTRAILRTIRRTITCTICCQRCQER
jgi:hypothetical protein